MYTSGYDGAVHRVHQTDTHGDQECTLYSALQEIRLTVPAWSLKAFSRVSDISRSPEADLVVKDTWSLKSRPLLAWPYRPKTSTTISPWNDCSPVRLKLPTVQCVLLLRKHAMYPPLSSIKPCIPASALGFISTTTWDISEECSESGSQPHENS